MTSSLGPWVRLSGIPISQLPLGGKGVEPSTPASSTEKFRDGSGSVAAPNIQKFITDVLSESIPFIDGVAPKAGGQTTWKTKGSPKRFASSAAPVYHFERVVTGKDLVHIEGLTQSSAESKDETWFCRRSCHGNMAEKGTASWEEFNHSFKEHHAGSEEAFTPNVIGAREAMRWNTTDIEVDVHGERWINITVVVEEMKHKIDPKPLKNRTFPVIQVAASLKDTQEFVVVSIPLTDFQKSPYAEYARDKSLVVAAYTAIERIRVLPDSGDVEWIMATASDAGGVLPQWMQNMAVPGAIAKDVDLFLSWISSQRSVQDKPAPISKTESAAPAASPPVVSNGDDSPSTAKVDLASKDLPATPVE